MKYRLKFKNSLFFKFMLSFILPIAIISVLFSLVLYITSTKIIDNYVITQFESSLKIISGEIKEGTDKDLVLGADEDDMSKYDQLLKLVNEMQRKYGVENVYLLSRAGGTEHIVALSKTDNHDAGYVFNSLMHSAIDNQKVEISEVYEDEYGIHKSIFVPFEGTEIILGLDMDASFVKDIQNIILWISTAISILAIISGIIISYVISRRTIKPINNALAYVTEVSQGKLNVPTFNLNNEDEISMLAKGLFTMVDDLRHLIVQVNVNSKHVAATSEELSASVEQTSATIEEITSSVQEIAQNADGQTNAMNSVSITVSGISQQLIDVTEFAKDVTENAYTTTTSAQEGNNLIQNAVSQMSVTTSMISDTSGIVNRLSDYTKEIGEIVNLITAITEQTNLLALNASIEAARAGEHGKGFAVVAEEVRKLADQSQHAASDITTRIDVIRKESSLAVDAMSNSYKNLEESTKTFELAGTSFGDIYQSVNELASKMIEVQKSIQTVNDDLSNISTTIRDVNDSVATGTSNIQTVAAATEEQSASIEEIASSATNLATMGEQLRQSMTRFEL
ncbi:methyl-accepting chemotaxis protein [Solibacillus sp. FSL H8-0538]|uniref:methyl-accepting chemotaxis protein n=1 Tax=Solibacillus sp. FSL H8-0538 TaxID=2921400 RepID=UPI0030FA382C